MVNTGRPSRGCALCRKRKIKCDEARPSCRNCSKYGRECPGWPELPSLLRARSNELQAADRKSSGRHSTAIPRNSSCPATERIKYSSTPELEKMTSYAQPPMFDQAQGSRYNSSTNSSPIIKTSPLSNSHNPSSMLPESVDHLEETAIDYLFTCGIMSAQATTLSDVDPVDAICEMCRESGPLSPLSQAVKAAALANLANRTAGPELRMRARNEYGKAIISLKYALGNAKSCLEDSTLATLLMLRMCEILFSFNSKPYFFPGENDFPIDNWQSHVEGMHALLRLRGPSRLSTPRERWLFQVTWRGARAGLHRDCREPDELLYRLEGELAQRQAPHLYPLVACYLYYSSSVGKLRAEIKGLVERSRTNPSLSGFDEGLAAMVHAAEELDAGIDDWLQRNDQWQPLQTSPEIPMDIVHGRTFARAYFADPVVFIYRRRLSFVRIKLHESLIMAHSAKLTLMERGQAQSRAGVAEATSANFAAVDKLIMRHVDVVRREVAMLLGWVSYGLGDIGDDGMVMGTDGGAPDTLRFDDGHKLGLQTIEVYVYLAPVVQSELLTEDQAEAAGWVLRRIVDWFRRPAF